MARVAKNAAVKSVDEYLKFVQQHFNVDSVEQRQIVQTLKYISSDPNYNDYIRKQAELLIQTVENINILNDNYNKFDKLGNFGFDSVAEVYSVSNDILKDINVARNWLKLYMRFLVDSESDVSITPHDKLLTLGKSILARAVELTPMKTGLLRSSAVLIDFGTHITIAYTAPYASYVHENLNLHHPHHPSNPDCGGRAKFLEIALQEFLPYQSVWVESHGFSGIEASIALDYNNNYVVEYKHFT